jgi:hypothetical protein
MPVFGEKRTCLVARISGANHSKWSTLLWGEWRRPKRYLAGLYLGICACSKDTNRHTSS